MRCVSPLSAHLDMSSRTGDEVGLMALRYRLLIDEVKTLDKVHMSQAVSCPNVTIGCLFLTQAVSSYILINI